MGAARADGNRLVFPKERVDAALSSYLRFANLAAQRELAQLWLDDSVPDAVAAFAAARGISGPVNASVIVVGLEGSPADEWLIRYAAHLDGIDLSARTSRAASSNASRKEQG